MAALEPMSLQLGQALGRRVEMLPMSSYSTMVEAQSTWRIDGGFYSASAYAAAQERCGCLEPIAAPAAADGTVAYRAIVVARRNSGISAAAGLDGKTVAVGAADSVAARLMQKAGLAEEGIDAERFGSVREYGIRRGRRPPGGGGLGGCRLRLEHADGRHGDGLFARHARPTWSRAARSR